MSHISQTSMSDQPLKDTNNYSKSMPEGRQEQLLATLGKLLEIQAIEVKTALSQAAQLVADVLAVDKVDIFLHETASDTLVSVGVSDTPMGRRQRAIGMDRMPIANKGRAVEVFQTGKVHMTGHADQDAAELVGVTEGLGVRSSITVPLEVASERRGLLMIVSATPDFFSKHDLHFIEAVAHWVGIVMHRAELVEQLTSEAITRGRRLAAEELLTILAHDVRNFLTPIKGHIDLLLRRATREQRDKDIADARSASKALDRLSHLISEMLDVARLDQGLFAIHPQLLNIVDLVQETIRALSTPETEMQLHAPSEEMIICADAERVRQALENLLSNAIKHAPPGTPISVMVETDMHTDEAWAVLTVSNLGKSIPPEILANIFQPFVADPDSTGLGLGLYIASKIATAHHGTLTVDSLPEEGTSFHFAIPIVEEIYTIEN
ncbi:MAG: hypothetical protein NVSMB27_20350 [Ktedonobacteraceae bacterium]